MRSICSFIALPERDIAREHISRYKSLQAGQQKLHIDRNIILQLNYLLGHNSTRKKHIYHMPRIHLVTFVGKSNSKKKMLLVFGNPYDHYSIQNFVSTGRSPCVPLLSV